MSENKSFPISEYLGRAITGYKENFFVLLNFSCAASAPVVLRILLQVSSDEGLAAFGFILGPLVLSVYVFFFFCLIYAAASLLQGQVVTAKEIIAHVWAKFWRCLGAYLLFAVIILIGTLLFLVPGIYCMTVLLFYPFVILLENKGIRDSLKRSHELVKGYFWPVLRANVVVFLISLGMFIPLVFGLKMIGSGDAVLFVIMGIVGALVAPVFVVFYYLIYDFLKSQKDVTVNISVHDA